MAHLQYTVKERYRTIRDSLGAGANVYDVYDKLLDTKLTKATIEEIEKLTRGQTANPAWHDLRQGIVTGSKVKGVIKGMEGMEKYRRRSSFWDDDPQDPVDLVMGGSSSEGATMSMQWGSDKKEDALVEYWEDYCSEVHDTHKLRRPGLVMSDKHPFLGVSPDAILRPKDKSDDSSPTLVKVKCPYFARSWEPEAAARKVGNKRANGDFYLTRQHDLNYKIQFQMGALGIDECDLVVYTNQGIHVETFGFDEGFYGYMIGMLSRFESRYLPEAMYLYD